MAAATLLSSLIFSGGAAQAAEPELEPGTYTQGMTIVGYDRELAASNGYEIRIDSQGREYSVKKGTPKDQGSTQRTTTIRGNCGSSFVTITAAGGKRIATGYTVRDAVSFSKWGATVSAPGATVNYNMDHGITGPSWSTYRTIGSYASGYVTGRVNDGSFAALNDGGLCFSGNPSVTDLI